MSPFAKTVSTALRAGAAIAAIALIGAPAAWAGHLAVCSQGCRFATIQSAIDHARRGDTVDIAQGVYSENLVVADKSLTLQGESAALTLIVGVTGEPVVALTCTNAQTVVRLADLAVTGGHPLDPHAGQGLGGGISNQGCSLAVDHGRITDNVSEARGGGILSSGSLLIVDSVVANNIGDSDAGLSLAGKTRLSRTLVTRNHGSGHHTNEGGGGIVNTGDLDIVDSDILDNASPTGCCRTGGIINLGTLHMAGSRLAYNLGGALFNGGQAEIDECAVTDNPGDQYVGGIENSGTLSLKGSLVAGNAGAGGGGIVNRGTLHARNSLLTRNDARHFGTGQGGALLNLNSADLNDVTIVGNFADSGGGIYNAAGATITKKRTSVTGNTPDDCAGTGIACP